MQTTIYSAHDEQELMARLWSPAIKNNPLAFVMYVFPWGEKGTPLEHFDGPRKWQRDVLLQIGEHIKRNNGKIDFDTLRLAVSSGRGIGKSALVSWVTIWMLSTRIGSTTIISANSENQLRSVTWAEITKWLAMAMNSHWFEVSATRVMPAKWLTELVERDLKKGTRYWGVEGRLWSAENPDAYAGVHNFDGVMVIFDEASGIDDAIWAVTSGFLRRTRRTASGVASLTHGATAGTSTSALTPSATSGRPRWWTPERSKAPTRRPISRLLMSTGRTRLRRMWRSTVSFPMQATISSLACKS
jgi:hypothetical protein